MIKDRSFSLINWSIDGFYLFIFKQRKEYQADILSASFWIFIEFYDKNQ